MRTSSRQRRAALALPALFALSLGLAACGSSSDASPSSASGGGGGLYGSASSPSNSSAKAAAPASGGMVLAVRSTSLGTILTNGKGLTAYDFAADKGGMSSCTGACLTAWPPISATGTHVQVGSGVKQSLVGETTRADGSRQVTYAGHPLYLYAGDSAPGDTNGQGSKGFGAEWDVLTAAGQVVGDDS